MEAGEEVFRQAISSIFSSWPALKIAVDRGSGGRGSLEKADWLPGAIASWVIENVDADAFEIEDCISTVLDEDFHLIVDDGSLNEVALAIHQCYSMYRQGQISEIESKFCHLVAAKVTVQENMSDSDEEEESDEPKSSPDSVPPQVSTINTPVTNGDVSMEEDTEVTKQNEEDEGWQQVKKGKGRRK